MRKLLLAFVVVAATGASALAQTIAITNGTVYPVSGAPIPFTATRTTADGQ